MEQGTTISPQRYLADTIAAADAVDAFSEALRPVAPIARAAALRRVAPALQEPLERTRAIASRLDAARLEDLRLEQQRAQAAAALGDVVAAMEDVLAAATAGRPAAAEQAAGAYADAVGELRMVSDPS